MGALRSAVWESLLLGSRASNEPVATGRMNTATFTSTKPDTCKHCRIHGDVPRMTCAIMARDTLSGLL
jgi:hypothetical protein